MMRQNSSRLCDVFSQTWNTNQALLLVPRLWWLGKVLGKVDVAERLCPKWESCLSSKVGSSQVGALDRAGKMS